MQVPAVIVYSHNRELKEKFERIKLVCASPALPARPLRPAVKLAQHLGQPCEFLVWGRAAQLETGDIKRYYPLNEEGMVEYLVRAAHPSRMFVASVVCVVTQQSSLVSRDQLAG